MLKIYLISTNYPTTVPQKQIITYKNINIMRLQINYIGLSILCCILTPSTALPATIFKEQQSESAIREPTFQTTKAKRRTLGE